MGRHFYPNNYIPNLHISSPRICRSALGSIQEKNIELLESVQKFACKVCLKCWDMDNQNMLHCLDIPPLSVRQGYLKLITMFKGARTKLIIHEHVVAKD